MKNRVLKVHEKDNVIIALQDLRAGDYIDLYSQALRLNEDIKQKHKFAERDFRKGEDVVMYGVIVGKTTQPIQQGGLIHVNNVKHHTAAYGLTNHKYQWSPPDVGEFASKTFKGYHRENGSVGTMNYWLVIPLVFCENRNIKVIREAMSEQLGYATESHFSVDTQSLIKDYQAGSSVEELLKKDIIQDRAAIESKRIFPNVDGIKFLTHEGGCGGTRQDSEILCQLLATYILHPNVAGATVLSLGCQHAQIELLKTSLSEYESDLEKPVYFLEQQESRSEREFIATAVKKTFVGLIEANKIERQPAPVSKITLGLECGGSDGFSGITANPALGYTSDLLIACGGAAVLSEFPELNGVEQDLMNRCKRRESAIKFSKIMSDYSERAKRDGSGFAFNPSPGNIKDGLITDAIKSAGAAKKGGTSPVVDVLDYTERVKFQGLNLLCTPGNDVESTTGLASAGSNVIVFTTGLGTPTGNAVTPTIKMSTNTQLAQKMPDLIDIDAGTIINGAETIESKGRELLDLIIKVASGDVIPKAVQLGQDDFIPWKRGTSL